MKVVTAQVGITSHSGGGVRDGRVWLRGLAAVGWARLVRRARRVVVVVSMVGICGLVWEGGK